MLRKIRIDELKLGMVVEKMDRSWLEHPFLTNRKKITSAGHIDRLREYNITELYINTEVGDDVADPDSYVGPGEEPGPDAAPADSPAPDPVVVVTSPAPPPPPPEAAAPPNGAPALPTNLDAPLKEEIPLHVEIEAAKVAQKEAHSVVNEVLHNVRLGKNIESEKAGKAVNHMIDSIFRNMDALASLTRIKGYDEYTFVHSVNVCVLSLTLGRTLGLDREELQSLGMGALLHDAGKMKVPPEILNKPGKLTDVEFAEMKKHTLYSVEVLDLTEGITDESKAVALQHHERFSGAGYPGGLAGETINRCAQIAAIADTYDAMTTTRVYSKPMSPPEGIRRIYDLSKTEFNPIFAQRFIQCLGIYPIGTTVQLDTSEIGIVLTVNHDKILRPKVLLICRDERRRLPAPLEVDLTEPAAPGSPRFKRTIAKPVDPSQFGIEVDLFLPKAAI
jgi:HD-GYP domain-containing protein (c-di-GMP phosphodiesterase class II)